MQESTLRRSGQRVEVQPKVLDTLHRLVVSRGRLLTKEELLAALWPDAIVGEESLTQAIRKLRGVLEDDPRQPRFIETVVKRGYRWIAPVTVDAEGAAESVGGPPAAPLSATAASDQGRVDAAVPRPDRRPHRSQSLLASLLILAAAGALFFAGPSLIRSLRRPPPEPFAFERLKPRRLTTSGQRELHSWIAPDDRTYVYSANEEGQFDLFLGSLAGGEPVRLTRSPEDEFAPQISPDGSRILFGREHPTQGGGTLWIAGALGGNERMLSSQGAEGAFSPDGRSVAYARREKDGGSSLVRIDLASGTESPIFRSAERLSAVAWQPSKEWIAFSEGGRIRVIPAAGGAVRALSEDSKFAERLAWDPAGGSLVTDAQFPGEDRRLWRIYFDSQAPHAITPPAADTCCPALSANGRHLIFTVESKKRQIWHAPGNGGEPEVLPLPSTVEGFDVAPDGHTLAFTDWEARPGATSLGVFHFGDASIRVLGEGLAPAFSPDGRSLAFLGAVSAEEGLWILDLQSGERRRMAVGTGPAGFRPGNLDRRPSWSPDGRRIAFTDLGGTPALVVVDVEDRAEHRLVEARLGPAAWSPDGGRLAACGSIGRETGLFLVDAVSGDTALASARCSYRAAPIWESDGTIRLLVGERSEPALLSLAGRGGPPGPPEPLRRVFDPAFWGVFDVRPDGAGGWVYLLERYEGDLYLLDAAR